MQQSQLSYYSNSQVSPSSVVIDRVVPMIDGGRFAVKRYLDEDVKVTAHLLVHGHDLPKGRIHVRHQSEMEETAYQLVAEFNDEWSASFKPKKLGQYICRVEASLDRFGTWKNDVQKKRNAGQNITVDLQIGVEILRQSLQGIQDSSEKKLIKSRVEEIEKWIQSKRDPDVATLQALLSDPALVMALQQNFNDDSLVKYDREVVFNIEPTLARFSSWYEFFPRSVVSGKPRHGTFKDAEARLSYVKDLGFNVVYFPPIHPIGKSYRKGKNNSVTAEPGDVGSPWAIGAEEGGHKAILSELGTLQDFKNLITKARSMNLEIAMDIAFQCSPDHPYVKAHPEWFKKRPDGTIQYAENPPKKYQDIYPFDFETPAWKELWQELLSVFQYWINAGVRVFRVDNPHTKPFHFWEWLIANVRQEHPDVIFLSEAFTRPKIMQYLAKSGFNQSYTYFTWRNAKWELTEYMNELTQSEMKDYFGANFWPNTPDILHDSLQSPNPAQYKARLVLAATLMSNYGIYGPAFELMDYKPSAPGKEEYLDSEKYQLRTWNLNDSQSLAPYIVQVNKIRNSHKALQQNRTFRFHPVNNDSLIAYSKSFGEERIITVVNLDSKGSQSGMLELPLIDWNIGENQNFDMEDLLTGVTYTWNGWRNYVELRPDQPAHIFKLNLKSKYPQGTKA
ncbi:alpha-1,4-glucan--maltose-1-phosphate maltosyltransferase [Bdellovibrio sp. SKB1291214]|uniref:maltotransferase domain-containing protein n=1 Tax=Bdellovibrio sp. SKB1291214 TaxID=1732569 RepID=UPI000B51C20B|nr:maltotransferase domain-containing protein [Bdellovibrio sp. SKB1291214]UYL09627.1 alpha-1,4-glucan--maltose-1-phosphate maltosyltransferase [Bdellovibrio sp. SKB1291214]